MTTQMPDIMPQRVLLEYLNEGGDVYNGQRCVGDRCYAEDYYNRIPRGRQITDESSDDDWTFEFILSQIWRKYPYVLLSVLLSVLLLVITTVWLCGRHVSTVAEFCYSYAECLERSSILGPLAKW